MPNTVVKLSNADDSALEAARENMSLPDFKSADMNLIHLGALPF